MSGIEMIDWKCKQRRLACYGAAHDDALERSELAHAAAHLAIDPTLIPDFALEELHLWPAGWEAPIAKDRIEELAEAGALIVAEIERLQRLQAKQAEQADG
jgi:hypothetical protein